MSQTRLERQPFGTLFEYWKNRGVWVHQDRLSRMVARTIERERKENKTHTRWQGSQRVKWLAERPLEGGGYVHVVVEYEEVLPAVLHDVLAEVVDEVGDGDRLAVLVVGGDGELVLPLVREEHLEAAPEESQHGTFDLSPFLPPSCLSSL